ncbi:MAG: hypothetical protein BWY09_01776 [Candidatus Hydrogenedentes bacterium ADurb.Bin179]|nr:MAG: hypothetical protein BWY09_01776 [Candidatus Hydrogenedentes bacterium ADurb.Bin179]
MKYSISIECNNAAFVDQGKELARILRDLADRLEVEGVTDRALMDLNGNRVGRVTVEED